MKFDKKGQWVGAKALKFRSAKPIITNTTPLRLSDGPITLEVGVKNAKGNWGLATYGRETWAKIDVRKISHSVAKWSRVNPTNLPLFESVIDGISETSVHELIHEVGKVGHANTNQWSRTDFNNVVAAMGHPTMNIVESLAGYKAKRKMHEIHVIDLPDDTPQPVGKVQPETVTIGNLTLKVRSATVKFLDPFRGQ